MRKPIYLLMFIVLGFVLVAPLPSAFAQTRHGPPGARSLRHKSGPLVLHKGAQLVRRPLRSHKLGGRIYHGRLDWRHGRWHHGWRSGRFGWWWDVGGIWYLYPELIEGGPDYVSDIEVAEDPARTPPPQAEAPAPKKSRYAFYYRPGDLLGTRYATLEECLEARKKAGNVGICVMK